MLTLPTILNDRYRLLERLASGGFADVYRGEDTVLEREVAVKVVRDLAAVADQPFAREVAALARLNHPAIVRLFDGGTDGEVAFLVMELVDGRPLDDMIASQGRLALEAVREIGRQAAAALAHAHAAGLVHRDVKPGNLVVDDAGRVRVTDFGVARIIDETVTTTSGTLGTAAYLAPEQVDSARVGPPADVYALGLVLLECLTGERAFPGSLTESALARLGRDPDVPDDLPSPWPSLLTAMTARDPAQRPTAEAVAARLDEGGDAEEATVTLPADSGEDDDTGTRVLEQAPPPAREGPAPRADHGNRWLAALVVALILMAGALFVWSEVADDPVPDPVPAEDADEEAGAPESEREPPGSLEEALDRLEEAVSP